MKRLLAGWLLAGSSGLVLAQGTDGLINAPILGTGSNAPITGSNASASSDPGEHRGLRMAGGHSVWFRIDLTTTATFNAKTEGSSFDTTLALYRGAHVSEMRELAGNDDAGGNTWSEIVVNLQPGTYYLALDGYDGATGNYTLSYQFALGNAAAAAPPNNAFANAQSLSGAATGAVVRADVRFANTEAGEGGGGDASVWYRYEPTQGGPVSFRTLDSAFDSQLQVYTGSALNALNLVASNDDIAGAQGNLTSEVRFSATAGTTYRIRLSAIAGTRGTTYLAYGPASMNGLPNLDASYNGVWWNPSRSGEGVLLEVSNHPDPHTLGEVLNLSWYTYDPDGRPVYLIGAAVIDPTAPAGTPIAINMITTRGARFGAAFNPAEVVREPWGKVNVVFYGCNQMLLAYEPSGDAWGEDGAIAMNRVIARAPGNSCP